MNSNPLSLNVSTYFSITARHCCIFTMTISPDVRRRHAQLTSLTILTSHYATCIDQLQLYSIINITRLTYSTALLQEITV